MAKTKPKQAGRRYRAGGLDRVWKWITAKAGHGIERTQAALSWARRRGRKAKPGQRHPFRKAARIYGHRLHRLLRIRHRRRVGRHQGHDTVTMQDSVEASALDPNVEAALYYTDGAYANEAAVKARTPHALHTGITPTGATHGCKGADIEPGDLTPESGAGWCAVEIGAGNRPGPYESISAVPAVVAALEARGIDWQDVDWLTAHYIGPHICDEHCWSGLPVGFKATGTQHTGSMVASRPDVSLVERRFFD